MSIFIITNSARTFAKTVSSTLEWMWHLYFYIFLIFSIIYDTFVFNYQCQYMRDAEESALLQRMN